MSESSYYVLHTDGYDEYPFYADENGNLQCTTEFIHFKLEDWAKLPYDKIKTIAFIIDPEEKDSMPKDLNVLSNLETLWLNYCYLDVLPDISGLTKLKNLHCSYNNFKFMPSLSTLTSLEFLTCYNTKITHFESLDGLSNLKVLYCYENELTTLPRLDDLVSLEDLQCANNKITKFPDFSKLQKLEGFDFRGNPLMEIPYSIIHCKSLKYYKPFDDKYEPEVSLPELINKRIKYYYYKDIIDHHNMFGQIFKRF